MSTSSFGRFTALSPRTKLDLPRRIPSLTQCYRMFRLFGLSINTPISFLELERYSPYILNSIFRQASLSHTLKHYLIQCNAILHLPHCLPGDYFLWDFPTKVLLVYACLISPCVLHPCQIISVTDQVMLGGQWEWLFGLCERNEVGILLWRLA